MFYTTHKEITDYVVRELTTNLKEILEGINIEYLQKYQGKAMMCSNVLANLGYDVKIKIELEKMEY